MDYQQFKDMCEKNGLKGVSEKEYGDNAPDPSKGRSWSEMTSMRRIRNARNGVGRPTEMKTIIGYVLGGREYSGDDINSSWKQFVTVMSADGKLTEVDVKGSYNGKHGYRSEIRYEESEGTSKDGQTKYVNRNVREVVVGKEAITLEAVLAKAKTIDDLVVEDLKTPVIIKGIIGENFRPESFWEDGKVAGDFPVVVNKQPVFQFSLLAGKANMVTVRLTPRKISEPILEFPDLITGVNLGSLEQVAMNIAGAAVLVVGYMSKWEQSRSRDGRNFVTIIATAIWQLPEPAYQPTLEKAVQVAAKGGPAPAQKPVTLAPATVAPASTTVAQPATPPPTPAPTPAPVAPAGAPAVVKLSVQERARLIKQGVEKAAGAVGGIDKVTVQNARELNKDIWTWGDGTGPSDASVDANIKKLQKAATPAPTAPPAQSPQGPQ
ncbi:Uncharacterised protein [uncultured archaeon]|nr:Uncharacterised protein [uncultured archaeon]